MLGHTHEVFVLQWLGVVRVVLDTGHLECLLPIGRDEGQAPEIEGVNRLGIEAEPGAVPLANRLEFIEVFLGDDALAVVADNDGV